MKNTLAYNSLVQKMREFFLSKNFVEVPTQSRLSILAACENPHSIATFNYNGEIWPLPQTGQMWLEHELLNNPHWDGCFCISTSYRQEKNPIAVVRDVIKMVILNSLKVSLIAFFLSRPFDSKSLYFDKM